MGGPSAGSILSPAQSAAIAEALEATYFAGFNAAHKASAEFQRDIHDQVEGRYRMFADAVVPWIGRHIDISGHKVVEIGSGTGSSTAAIAQRVGHVFTFEISEPAVAAARARSDILGYTNVTHQRRLFDASAVAELGSVDGVFLAAVLEHCTFEECIGLLTAAWEALKPGGWLCVVDTPNRLSPIDHHTSNLPFFSALPIDVRILYATRSPRADLVRQFGDLGDPTAEQRMIRWGNGISYHEFEIAIGPHVHDNVIADGWEPEINKLIDILPDDTFTAHMLRSFAPNVNRAFGRRSFYFIIRKPG